MSEALAERESFRIENDSQAEWALRKIREADAELERMGKWFSRQMDAAKQKHDSDVEYFTGLLQEYFREVPAKETKTMRKYALPSGELVLNKSKQAFTVSNSEELLGWCKVNDPTLVKVSMTASWADVKKRLKATDAGVVDTETGLVVDGVQQVDVDEEFKVRLKEGNENGADS